MCVCVCAFVLVLVCTNVHVCVHSVFHSKVDDVCEARKEDAARIKEIFLLLMHSAAAQSPVIARGSSPCLAESTSPIPPADRSKT